MYESCEQYSEALHPFPNWCPKSTRKTICKRKAAFRTKLLQTRSPQSVQASHAVWNARCCPPTSGYPLF